MDKKKEQLEVKVLQERVAALSTELTNEKRLRTEERKTLQNTVEEKTETIEKLKKTALKKEQAAQSGNKSIPDDTLFLATLQEEKRDFQDKERIVWDRVLINPGEHYNAMLGMYTAPVDGYYKFDVIMQVTQNSNLTQTQKRAFYLLVDEKRCLEHAYHSTNQLTATMAVNVQLKAGQIVRVENGGYNYIHGADPAHPPAGEPYRSFFTGHLLCPL